MKLVSWNVHMGHGGRTREQCALLCETKPDIVCLQEVTPRVAVTFREELAALGLAFCIDNCDAPPFGRGWRLRELIASRWPTSVLASPAFDVPRPERILSADIATPWGGVEVHTAHVPSGEGSGFVKIETFEGISRRLACTCQKPRILCGDFNSPKSERPDGQVLVWGQTDEPDGVIRTYPGDERWVAGERSVIVELAEHDLPDVFRLVNGYSTQQFSWYHNGNPASQGRRYDHVFASRALNPTSCRYARAALDLGLSDHLPMETTFAPIPWEA